MQKDLLIDSKNAYIFYINISIRLPLAFTLNFPELKKNLASSHILHSDDILLSNVNSLNFFIHLGSYFYNSLYILAPLFVDRCDALFFRSLNPFIRMSSSSSFVKHPD